MTGDGDDPTPPEIPSKRRMRARAKSRGLRKLKVFDKDRLPRSGMSPWGDGPDWAGSKSQGRSNGPYNAMSSSSDS